MDFLKLFNNKDNNMEEEEKDFEAMEILVEKMHMLDYADSFGTIILRNGAVLQIGSFFEYFREYWNDYKMADAFGDTEKMSKFLEETQGGIVSNGEIEIDIKEIIATVAIHKMLPDGSKAKKAIQQQFNSSDFKPNKRQIITDDNIDELGDSEPLED